jgi:hypothetical protein
MNEIAPMSGATTRQPAKDALRFSANRLRKRAEHLEALANLCEDLERLDESQGADGNDGYGFTALGSPAELALWELAILLQR